MLRHAAILSAAVVSAIAAAQGLTAMASPRAAAPAEIPAPVPAATLRPAVDAAPPSSPAQLSKSPDGHYWAEADVNGRWVRLLVDTGASAVALTPTDARRLGFDPAALDYDRPVTTANGQTRAAEVVLDRVSVAGTRLDKVEALVVREGLSTSLLGMTYLGRLSRFEATPTALILRP